MYSFRDTIDKQYTQGLPSEALNINGKYIENEIEGYQTLKVSGRELLDTEIIDVQVGDGNGSYYQSKRMPAREITVTYQILSKSLEEFREKFNRLNLILSQEQAKLIFADELDKYFIGTKSSVGEVPDGLLNVVGEFSFYCTDPRKYSDTQKSFQASLNPEGAMEMTISNTGTESVPVDYEIKHNHENGFIGIVSEYGVIQLGHVNEMDMEEKEKSEYLLNYRQASQYEAMRSGSGIFFDPSYGKSGTFGTYNYDNKTWVSLASAGVGSGWHGAARTIDLPPDQTGISGSANFAMQGKVWFRPTATNQCGIIEYCIADKNGRHLASARIAKWNPVTDTALLILCVNGKEVQRIEFNSALSELFVHNRGDFYISKSGRKITFCFGGIYSFNIADIEKMEAKTVSVFIGQRDNHPIIPKMYLNYLVFRKDRVKTWHDVPNRYPAGSTVIIDGKSRKIYVDGVHRAADEVLGSKYFNVPPGETKIQFYYSDFCSPPPTITAKIQEAYL